MADVCPSTHWWETIETGAEVELGFVRIDRVGSTQDWQGLSQEQVIARRAEFHQLAETFADGFAAMQPILWQGDGAMLFIASPQAAVEGGAARQAGLLAIELHQRLLLSGFNVRLGVHCGRVAFERDAGTLASPEIDRAGHLEHDCPTGAVALSEDVYLSLPEDQRERCAYLGTTVRDQTVAFVYPKAVVARRDPAYFVAAADDTEPTRQRLLDSVRGPDIRRLRYVGFRLARKEPPSLDLFDVFTPLNVEEHRATALGREEISERSRAQRKSRRAAEEDLRDVPWSRPGLGVAAPRPFTDVFRLRRHLVVLGGPGAGKSTLLRWLALTAAGGRTVCRQRLGVDERMLPLLVPIGRLFELRESLRRARDTAGGPSVVDAMAQYFHERNAGEDVAALAEVLRRRLEAGDCLVLLDGLDEVPTERRHEVTRWIESFAGAFRDNRFVVTGRVFGYVGIDLPGGATVVVRPFTDDQVRDYLTAWYRAYRAWEANLSAEEAARDQPAADAESRRLLDVLEKDVRLRALASNPFLLSALALVHRAEGQLPAHRVQLYDIFARALCETWNQARRLAASDTETARGMEYETEAIPILGRLAFWLHEHHSSGVAPESEVKAEIARALVEESRVSADEAAHAAERFLQRAGEDLQVIAERGPALYGFLHLTFEEFFAAQYLHAKERFEAEAQQRWFDPRWEEVILLGVGTLSMLQKRPVAAGQFIRNVLDWKVPGHPWVTEILKKHVILAAKCCADAPNLDASVYMRVTDSFVPLLLGEDHYRIVTEAAHPVLARLRGSPIGTGVGEILLAALREGKDQGVRTSTAAALGALGDTRAFDPLLTALREDKDAGVRGSAADALGVLGDVRAIDPLLAALREDKDEWVRGSAADALGVLGDVRAVDPLLVTLREDKDEWVRRRAADALGALGDARAFDPLRVALRKDKDVEVRAGAAAALGALGDARAVDPLLAALREGRHAGVRAGAAAALGALGDARAFDPLLVTLREDKNEWVRNRATDALGALGDVRAVDPLLVALRKDKHAGVRNRAAVALAALGDTRAVDPLLATLRDGRHAGVRNRAAVALAALGDTRAVDPLLATLRDGRHAGGREGAATALWLLSERLPGALLAPSAGARRATQSGAAKKRVHPRLRTPPRR